MSSSMTSSKPYIIKAFYEWISDNELTPYITVDVNVYGVLVPMAYVHDEQITLNISLGAVGHISMGGDAIEFSARFNGKLEHMVVPYGAISAIYAKENGAGTNLSIEHPAESDDSTGISLTAVDNGGKSKEPATKKKSKSHLKVIK